MLITLGVLLIFYLLSLAVLSQADEPVEKQSNEVHPGTGIMALTGGYLTQIHIPEGIDDLQWEENEFDFGMSIGIDEEGKVVSVERVEYDEAMKQPWKIPFEKSCVISLEKWRFKPARVRSGEAVAMGIPIHIKFQKNRIGSTNIKINDGGGVILTTNSHFEK